MKIDINNVLTFLIGLVTLIGTIYKLAQVEANINARISLVEYNLSNKISATEKKLEVHTVEYLGDKENIYEYRLNATDKTIEHKFNRLANWINQIATLLHQQYGFQIRDDKF